MAQSEAPLSAGSGAASPGDEASMSLSQGSTAGRLGADCGWSTGGATSGLYPGQEKADVPEEREVRSSEAEFPAHCAELVWLSPWDASNSSDLSGWRPLATPPGAAAVSQLFSMMWTGRSCL